jgi:hypothetical protein
MIKTPPGWGADVLTQAYHSVTAVRSGWTEQASAAPGVRRIGGHSPAAWRTSARPGPM